MCKLGQTGRPWKAADHALTVSTRNNKLHMSMRQMCHQKQPSIWKMLLQWTVYVILNVLGLQLRRSSRCFLMIGPSLLPQWDRGPSLVHRVTASTLASLARSSTPSSVAYPSSSLLHSEHTSTASSPTSSQWRISCGAASDCKKALFRLPKTELGARN